MKNKKIKSRFLWLSKFWLPGLLLVTLNGCGGKECTNNVIEKLMNWSEDFCVKGGIKKQDGKSKIKKQSGSGPRMPGGYLPLPGVPGGGDSPGIPGGPGGPGDGSGRYCKHWVWTKTDTQFPDQFCSLPEKPFKSVTIKSNYLLIEMNPVSEGHVPQIKDLRYNLQKPDPLAPIVTRDQFYCTCPQQSFATKPYCLCLMPGYAIQTPPEATKKTIVPHHISVTNPICGTMVTYRRSQQYLLCDGPPAHIPDTVRLIPYLKKTKIPL